MLNQKPCCVNTDSGVAVVSATPEFSLQSSRNKAVQFLGPVLRHDGLQVIDERQQELVAAALRYAERGWHVIPLHSPTATGCSCRKGPNCNCNGKHPRTQNGLREASTDPAQIRQWWDKWPHANIGIVTGRQSGVLVVDVDNKGAKCGSAALEELESRHGVLPKTLIAMTGSGEHRFFRHPDEAVKNSISKLADGVDIRAEGGYVVAAPSLHANGNHYCWVDAYQAVAKLPEWLLSQIAGQKEYMNENQEVEQNAFEAAPVVCEGQRNDTLYKVGCALRGQQGMVQGEILTILLEYNSTKCDPPLDDEEVRMIVDSVCRHPAEFTTGKSGKRLEQNPLYWFPFNTREWFADQNVALMDDAQTGQYIRLKAYAWNSGGFLPADENKLWKLARAKNLKSFQRNRELILGDYESVDVDGVRKLRHPAMAKKYADTVELWMKKRDAGVARQRNQTVQ